MAKIKVIDGCTLEIGDIIVRLAGVKAPEWGAYFFNESTNHLKELMDAGKEVKLRAVGVAYDEMVVEVSVDGKSVNKAMNAFLKKHKYKHLKKPGSIRLRLAG